MVGCRRNFKFWECNFSYDLKINQILRKTLFLLITLSLFNHLSYASFPVLDTLKMKQDKFQIEEILQYDSILIAMGIDLNA